MSTMNNKEKTISAQIRSIIKNNGGKYYQIFTEKRKKDIRSKYWFSSNFSEKAIKEINQIPEVTESYALGRHFVVRFNHQEY